MVATFVVEDGTGVVGANSYATIAVADQYHFDIGTTAALWEDLTDPQKQQGLRHGTRYLDQHYGRTWKGRRTDRVNPLDWPRIDVLDDDGYDIESNVMPQGLLDAVSEGALRSTTATLNPDLEGEGTITLKREQVDGLHEETEYAGGLNQYITYTVIDDLLHDLVEPSGSRLLGRA